MFIPMIKDTMVNVFLGNWHIDGKEKHMAFFKQVLQKRDMEVLEDFLKMNHIDKKRNGSTLLHTAVFENDLSFVTLLLQKGANINAQDKEGRTPLAIASYFGFETMVEHLLKKGANPLIRDEEGKTARHRAMNGWKGVVHGKVARIITEKEAKQRRFLI